MKAEKSNVTTFEEMKGEFFGKIGTAKRDKYEAGFENFKAGYLLQQARLAKGLTQEELAVKAGTTKSYISKIENNLKEARLSTLQRIVEVGLGGRLELSIRI
jgi:DNA-binding XRE family transcriptional regulator